MAEGYKIGDGYVEIRADVNDTSTTAAGKKITEEVQAEVDKGAPVIGRRLGKGVEQGVDGAAADMEGAGRRAADSVAKGVEAETTKVEKTFSRTGDRSGKSLMESAGRAIEQDAEKFQIPFMPGGGVSAPMLGAISGVLGPAIVAALAGAVTLGVGTIGLLVGAELEKSNTLVQSSLVKMEQDTMGVLTTAASPFIAGLSGAFSQIGTFFKQNSQEFSAFFIALEPAIRPVVSMLTDLVHTIMPGLTALAGTFSKAMASPAVQGAMHAMAESINLFFQTIANNKDLVEGFFIVLASAVMGVVTALAGATEGVKLLAAGLGLTGGAADSTTGAIVKLINSQKLYNDSLYAYNQALADGNESLFTFTGQLESGVAVMANNYIATQMATDQYKALQQQLNATSITASTLAGEMTDKLFGSIMNSRRATLSWNESLLNLSDTLRKNKNDLRDHTHAGQADQAAILDALQANLGIYDSMIQAGYSADKATAAYEANIASLEKLMHQAGLSDSQIKTMVGDLASAPHDVNIAVAIEGLTTAIDQFKELIAQINGVPIALHKLTEASYNTVYGGTGDQGAGRASGGSGNPSLPKGKNPPPISGRAQRFGGITYAAQGLVGLGQGQMFMGGSPLVGFAEPGVKKEGFVPENGVPGRSIPIIGQEANWYGYHIARNGEGTPPVQVHSGGRTYNVTINLNGPWNALDPAMPRRVVGRIYDELQRYEKSTK